MFAAGQLYVSFRAWRSNLFKDISSRRSVIISFVTYVNGEMIFGLSYSLRYYYIFMVSKGVSYFYFKIYNMSGFDGNHKLFQMKSNMDCSVYWFHEQCCSNLSLKKIVIIDNLSRSIVVF